jgi:Uncharacterised protein family (UPF0158)
MTDQIPDEQPSEPGAEADASIDQSTDAVAIEGLVPRVEGQSPSQEPAPPFSEAFAALQAALQTMRARGRITTAAGVKTELQRQTAGGFQEKDLGLTSFAAFLEAARAAGVVELRPRSAPGIDTLVGLPGEILETPPLRAKGRRIRTDLWNAFVNWDPSWQRFWDTKHAVAVMFPTQPLRLEPEGYRLIRAEAAVDARRFLAIPWITIDQQLAAMTQFVDELDEREASRDTLRAALASEKPVAAFTSAARAFPSIGSAWNACRYQLVLNEIRRWITANQLDIDPEANERTSVEPTNVSSVEKRVPPISTPRLPYQPRESRQVVINAEAARRRILFAVNRMPLYELLRLPIPAAYLFDIE